MHRWLNTLKMRAPCRNDRRPFFFFFAVLRVQVWEMSHRTNDRCVECCCAKTPTKARHRKSKSARQKVCLGREKKSVCLFEPNDLPNGRYQVSGIPNKLGIFERLSRDTVNRYRYAELVN